MKKPKPKSADEKIKTADMLKQLIKMNDQLKELEKVKKALKEQVKDLSN